MLGVIVEVKGGAVAESVRDRMVVGAAQLLSRAGLAEASFRNVVGLTGAPRGSIYHHFPGGKDELVAASMEWVGGRLLRAMRSTPVEAPDEVVVLFAGLFRRIIVDSAAPAGCAVAAVATAAPGDTGPGSSAAEVFRAWRRELAVLFVRTGTSAERADALALLTIAGVEGALVLARAEGDVAPFDRVVDELLVAVRASS